MNEPLPQTDAHCRRCGTCCTKGGPALHLQDLPLVKSGQIPIQELFTIRRGEKVHDNVRGIVCAAETEIIKIKGCDDTPICRYFDTQDDTCGIYAQRPLECRRLQCWAPQKLMAVYNQDRLTRRDLLSHIDGLWDLVCEHDEKCAYNRIAELVDVLISNPGISAKKQLSEIIQYDHHLRRLLSQKRPNMATALDFVLGRPLTQVLPHFGLAVTRDRGGKLIVHRKYR